MSSAPMVSIVIPCRNEVKAIEGTVLALLKSEYPNVEVLVVDGMSEDGTRELVQKLAAQDSRVRLVDNPKKLTPYAFNLGVVNSRGEYIQIVGSRNVLVPNYIPTLVKALNEHPGVACVGGDYQHVFDSKEGQYIALAMESKFGVGGSNYRTMTSDAVVDTVGIPLYRKQTIVNLGYFDESLTRNQDDEFNFRLRQTGQKIMYIHGAKATYLVRGSLKKAFHQFSQYGYFKVFVNRKHKAVTTLRQLVPALFLAFWPLGMMLAVAWPIFWFALAFTLMLYVGAGFWFAGKGLTLKQRFGVFKACVVLHFGYGVGYWKGICDFILLGQKDPDLKFQQQTT